MKTIWGVAAVAASCSMAAMGQTAARMQYRVMAEFLSAGQEPSGDWPASRAAVDLNGPYTFMQFADGGVMLIDLTGGLLWVDDAGVEPVFATGTRIEGMPAGDFRFQASNSFEGPVYRVADGRAVFTVGFRSLETGIFGEASILGTPRSPERADTLGVDAANAEGLASRWRQNWEYVGPFGGELAPYLSVGMPVGGVAPAGSTLRLQARSGYSGFAADGSMLVRGAIEGIPGNFSGVYRDGRLSAMSVYEQQLPGVSVRIGRDAWIYGMLADGSVVMANSPVEPITGYEGLWAVSPEGVGRDLVTRETELPGYDEGWRVRRCHPVVASDGTMFVLVESVSRGAEVSQRRALYWLDGRELRLIASGDDPALSMIGLMNLAAGGNYATVSSGGRAAWASSGGVAFAHQNGTVATTFRWGLPAPAMLEAVGSVQAVRVTGRSVPVSTDIGSDQLPRTTRMAEDGSLAVWARVGGRAFVVAARLNVCPADVNEDGFVDFFDYGDFVNCFESGEGCGRFHIGDFNQDGFTDFFDYAGFVEAFEVGC